eukprot:258753-Amphidinium_carterae.1
MGSRLDNGDQTGSRSSASLEHDDEIAQPGSLPPVGKFPQARHIKTRAAQQLLGSLVPVRTLWLGWHDPSNREPRVIHGAGSAQPDHFQLVPVIPSRHRARETVHQVSAPADSDMDT